MPLFKTLVNLHTKKTAVWLIKESSDYFFSKLDLSKEELTELDTISIKSKKLEWLSVRFLLHLMSEREERLHLVKDEYGKPYFKDHSSHISLSHTNNYTSALISNRNCGIDIQQLDNKLLSIAPRVLSYEEIKAIPADDQLFYCGLYWGAKEALYKAYGKKRLDFKKEIFVEQFIHNGNSFSSSGRISKSGLEIEFDISAYSIDQCIIVSVFQK